jgi:hypothetical protein
MQLAEILSHCNKIRTIDDLLNHFDSVIELARDDIYRIAKSKQILFNDFDFTFSCAVEILKNQLKKKHLKAIDRFFKCENIASAINWLIGRILNNMRNTISQRYSQYCFPQVIQLYEVLEEAEKDEAIEVPNLEKIDKFILKEGLTYLWKESIFDMDFMYKDMQYLCEKLELNIDEIIGSEIINLQKYKKEQAESGNSQLVFVF